MFLCALPRASAALGATTDLGNATEPRVVEDLSQQHARLFISASTMRAAIEHGVGWAAAVTVATAHRQGAILHNCFSRAAKI